MDGYQYLIARNRLMQSLEEALGRLDHNPSAERDAERHRLEAQFDVQLRELYAQVAQEYPGERKKKARPLTDPT
ncbi:MAG TPA: hypothetical protein VMV27_08680 [Candidatus Binataceae bacterium]|nr:hypothetical protein [Candidatus Binataceae bacterium]